jgi:hypothetical protein
MTQRTSEILAQHLDAAGLDNLAARARQDEFHDFKSPHALPQHQLMYALGIEAGKAQSLRHLERRDQILAIQRGVMNGDFDATKAESDDWAVSPEGRDALDQLLRSARK